MVVFGFLIGHYLEQIYLKKKKKSKRKKGSLFIQKLSKINWIYYLIFAVSFAIIYLFVVTSFFQGWQNSKLFDDIPDLLIFVVGFMIFSYGLKIKNIKTRRYIIFGGLLICLRRLLDIPFQEYKEIIGLLNIFIWLPILFFEFIGFVFLLIGYRGLKI